MTTLKKKCEPKSEGEDGDRERNVVAKEPLADQENRTKGSGSPREYHHHCTSASMAISPRRRWEERSVNFEEYIISTEFHSSFDSRRLNRETSQSKKFRTLRAYRSESPQSRPDAVPSCTACSTGRRTGPQLLILSSAADVPPLLLPAMSRKSHPPERRGLILEDMIARGVVHRKKSSHLSSNWTSE
jgi:hypothetical protein